MRAQHLATLLPMIISWSCLTNLNPKEAVIDMWCPTYIQSTTHTPVRDLNMCTYLGATWPSTWCQVSKRLRTTVNGELRRASRCCTRESLTGASGRAHDSYICS